MSEEGCGEHLADNNCDHEVRLHTEGRMFTPQSQQRKTILNSVVLGIKNQNPHGWDVLENLVNEVKNRRVDEKADKYIIVGLEGNDSGQLYTMLKRLPSARIEMVSKALDTCLWFNGHTLIIAVNKAVMEDVVMKSKKLIEPKAESKKRVKK